MDAKVAKPKVVPFSLKDAPSLIERVWPAQKISVESQKERKAGAGQTLTALGAYWKGRKPLVLVRACLLGALLPSTGDDEKDLEIFELLVGMSDDQIQDRFKTALTVEDINLYANPDQRRALLDEDGRLRKMPKQTKIDLMSGVLARMPYQARVEKLLRPEEVSEDILTGAVIQKINEHLRTTAVDLPELVEQLGVMRFGCTPRVGDTFCGGGSIPFEAARLGCEVSASDLNPVACMLTWGDLNILGASGERRTSIVKAQEEIIAEVDSDITRLGIEHDSDGNRAKVFLYCLETRCPQTGWMVPMAPSWVISKTRNVVAKLIANASEKRFEIEVEAGVSEAEMRLAEIGTAQNGSLVYTLDGETYSTPIKTIRGDRKVAGGGTTNGLRPWEKSDFIPHPDDVFQERLYCIQWITKDSIHKGRPEVFFSAVSDEDLAREKKVETFVRENLSAWQQVGLVPDMAIEAGEETTRLMRERGWKYWHHLFGARQLLALSILQEHVRAKGMAELIPSIAIALDNAAKLCGWNKGHPGSGEYATNVFNNMALNTNLNYAQRSVFHIISTIGRYDKFTTPIAGEHANISSANALDVDSVSDIYITDPPYADAVNYHEITEFFIAWLRKNPLSPFDKWIWDSRRPLAIKGEGEEFRRNMVESYKAMTNHMPDNGIQIVMFTHQSASVWADMSQIFWGAGLQVLAAWYIATETTSELKKGGYVQGTVILVLRKRKASVSGYKDEIVQEVKAEVAEQIDTMSGLNQTLKGRGRIENLFEDADLQMAGYAAALRVLTKYEKIDGADMTKEALRPRRAGDKNLVGEIIDFAVQVANEHMVPEHMTPELWEGLSGAERFYFKMMDIETTSLRKLDNYQNFAKAFRVNDYGALMGSTAPNKARLRTAKEFKKTGFEAPEFGPSLTRAALYAVLELENDVEGDDVLSHLKDMLPNYHNKRDDLAAIADYIARKREGVDETESRAARILHGLIRNERLG
jgi:putative DNA methylase